MKEPQFYSQSIVDAMAEHIITLEQSIKLHRETIARLRRVNSDLRRLKNIQHQNDEEFRSMCQESFDETIDSTAEAGLASAIETVEGLG
jgi:hypothetical protein